MIGLDAIYLPSNAKLTVVSSVGEITTHETSKFKYFGPSASRSVSGAGVFLDGLAVCSPKEAEVAGKVVLTDLDFADWVCFIPI